MSSRLRGNNFQYDIPPNSIPTISDLYYGPWLRSKGFGAEGSGPGCYVLQVTFSPFLWTQAAAKSNLQDPPELTASKEDPE